jgi:DNA-binding HxlR family transcriptional regulator
MYNHPHSISQENMTANSTIGIHDSCPAEDVLKTLSGKWKMQILMRTYYNGNARFNSLLRDIPKASKQSLTVALRELEADGLLDRTIIKQKPLHIEYSLSPHGEKMIAAMKMLEQVSRPE